MKIYKYTYMISFGGHGCFKCTELECRECEKTIKIKDGIFMETTMRKSNLNTVIPGYGMYTIYQTEENPKKAISSIQSVLKNKLRKTQEEIEKINASLEDLDEEMIQINADLLSEKDLKK